MAVAAGFRPIEIFTGVYQSFIVLGEQVNLFSNRQIFLFINSLGLVVLITKDFRWAITQGQD